MVMIKKREIHYVEATLHNLDNYSGEYEFTHLLNSTLGLIIFPHEYRRIRWGQSDRWTLKDYSELMTLSLWDGQAPTPTTPVRLRDILRKVRNGFAHHNIEFIKGEDGMTLTGVRITSPREGNKTFQAELTCQQLDKFARMIAKLHLDSVI